MAEIASAVIRGQSSDHGSSFGWNALSLGLAILVHSPIFFMRMDLQQKQQQDVPAERLVSVDLIDADALKPEEKPVVPEPVVVEPPPPEEKSMVERLRSLVKKDAPPPPPVPVPKPAPPPPAAAPHIALQPHLSMPRVPAAALQSKSGFQTTVDPALVREQKAVLSSAPGGIAPLSAQRLGTQDNRAAIKEDRGRFQVAQKDNLVGIGDNGGLKTAAPSIAIPVGRTGAAEGFSAPVTQTGNKGPIGARPPAGVPGPALGLRDSIIARDAAPIAIGGPGGVRGGAPGGVAGGVPGGTGTKRDAGRGFTAAPSSSGGLLDGNSSRSGTIAPAAAPIKRNRSLFSITGPLKDRKIEKQVTPDYPAWAQAQGLEAAVVLEFTVDAEGNVKPGLVTVRRTSGAPRLDETAITALKKWKFAPLPDSANRDEVGLITFNYQLS